MKKNKLFLLLFFLFSIFKANATHFSGGDILYECVGQDSFLVTVNLFRDCAGASSPTNLNVNFASTCGGVVSANLTRQSYSESSMLCASQISNSTCNGGSWPGVETHVYSGIVVLNAPCNSWTISWSSCCRNNQISNLVNPGGLSTYLYSTLYSGSDSCQSSPFFTSNPIPYVCMNLATNYNFGVIDPEGDSLVYFMSPGFENSTMLVPYSGTYTYSQPLPGANLVLDSHTGQMTFTPTAVGVYVVAVRVEKYDRATGTIRGVILRDVQIVVQNCTNNQPEIDSVGFYNVTGATLVDSNSLEACAGATIGFDISVSDPDTIQTLSILHNIYQALDSSAVVTITNGNPATIHVDWTVTNGYTGFYNFTVNGIDNACPVYGSVVAGFDITILPGLYVNKEFTICAGDSAQLEAQGGTSMVWLAISGSVMDTNSSSANYNATCSNCFDPVVFPNYTTSYMVVSNISSVCSNVDTVVVNVVPNFTVDATDDTVVCTGTQLPLSLATNPPSGSYSYQWTPNVGLSNDSIANPVSTFYDNTRYHWEVSKNGCTKTGNINIDVVGGFPLNNSFSGDTLICLGDSAQMELVFGNIPVPSCGISNSTCVGNNQSGVIGTGSATNTTWQLPAIYRGEYASTRHQILYLATELQAMGMSAGKIQAISFDLAATGTVTNFDNLEVKMGCTSSNDLDTGWEQGLVQVVAPATYVISNGWNQHTFTNEYNWDGVSNIVIEICYANPSSQTGGTASTRYSQSGFNSVRAYSSFNGNACSVSPWSTLTTERPNIKFDFCSGVNPNAYNYSWNPNIITGNPTATIHTVSPTSTTTYQLIISDNLGVCKDTLLHEIEVNTNAFNAGFLHDSVMCLNEAPQTFTPITLGGVFTGTGVSSNGDFDPSAAGVGVWPVNYNISTPVLCANDSTINITVLDLPDASFVEPEICVGTVSANLVPNTPGGVWSGNMIVDSIAGTFNSQGLSAGAYEVYYSITTSCTNNDTGWVHLIDPFQFILTQNVVDLCEGESIDLNSLIIHSSAPGQGSVPYTTFSDAFGLVDSNGIFNANSVVPGSYPVNIEVSNEAGQCGTSKTITVQVRELENAEIVGSSSFCSNQNVGRLFVSPWLFGAGVSYTQRPLGNLGINDTLTIIPYGQNGEFNPSLLGVGSWEITISYENVYGCIGTLIDTIYVLDPPTNGVTNMGNYLTATAGLGYDYQWVDCDDNNSPIVGATLATYTPGRKGRFAVEVKAGNCVITSDCYETWPVGIDPTTKSGEVVIHPNPVQNVLYVTLPYSEAVSVEVLDNTGKVVRTLNADEKEIQFSLEGLSTGMYILNIKGPSILFNQKLIKQ